MPSPEKDKIMCPPSCEKEEFADNKPQLKQERELPPQTKAL
jgi:hypothetical protein